MVNFNRLKKTRVRRKARFQALTVNKELQAFIREKKIRAKQKALKSKQWERKIKQRILNIYGKYEGEGQEKAESPRRYYSLSVYTEAQSLAFSQQVQAFNREKRRIRATRNALNLKDSFKDFCVYKSGKYSYLLQPTTKNETEKMKFSIETHHATLRKEERMISEYEIRRLFIFSMFQSH